jgi:hypothetical protein
MGNRMVERNPLRVTQNALAQLLEQAGAGKEIDAQKLHFEARTAHALAAQQSVLPGAQFPIHPELASLLHETWCRRATDWQQLRHPHLVGKAADKKLQKAHTCPGGHLGIPTRGVPCNVRGCPVCAGRKAALAYERLTRRLARLEQLGEPVELALVPVGMRDIPVDAGRSTPVWRGTMYGPGRFKIVAMPAGTDWTELPWDRLIRDREGWSWRPHYTVCPHDRAALARAVGHVFAYDLSLLTDAADEAYSKLSFDRDRLASNAKGVLRGQGTVASLVQCHRDAWKGKAPFVSAQPGVGGGAEVSLFVAEAQNLRAAQNRNEAATPRTGLEPWRPRVEDVIHGHLRAKGVQATVQCGGYWRVEMVADVARILLNPGHRASLVRARRKGTDAMVVVTDGGYFVLRPRPDAPGDYLVEPLPAWVRRCAESGLDRTASWGRPVGVPKGTVRGPDDSGPGTRRPRVGAEYYGEMGEICKQAPCMIPFIPRLTSLPKEFRMARLATLEDQTVRLLLSLSGRPISQKEFRQFARDNTESPNLTFALWEQKLWPLPFRMQVVDVRPLYGPRVRPDGRAPHSYIEMLDGFVEWAAEDGDSRPLALLARFRGTKFVIHDGQAPPGSGGALVLHGPGDKQVWLEFLDSYIGRFARAGMLRCEVSESQSHVSEAVA